MSRTLFLTAVRMREDDVVVRWRLHAGLIFQRLERTLAGGFGQCAFARSANRTSGA